MNQGGWMVKVLGREVWLEVEPETEMIVASCPEFPGCIARAESLDAAVLRMEELILERTPPSS